MAPSELGLRDVPAPASPIELTFLQGMSDPVREALREAQESLRLLRETRETRLTAAEGQARAATEEARRLDAEVKRLRGALLDLMAVDHTMRAVICQALGLPLPGQEGSDVE